jgi:hypothetical protein
MMIATVYSGNRARFNLRNVDQKGAGDALGFCDLNRSAEQPCA